MHFTEIVGQNVLLCDIDIGQCSSTSCTHDGLIYMLCRNAHFLSSKLDEGQYDYDILNPLITNFNSTSQFHKPYVEFYQSKMSK